MNSFLTGLGGVVVGVLLATVFGSRSDGPPTRMATLRLDGLERALARLEVVLDRHSPTAGIAATSPDPTPKPTATGSATGSTSRSVPDNEDPPRPHTLNAPEIIRKLETRTDMLEREVPTGRVDAGRKFLLWSIDQVVEKFGRPNWTNLSDGQPSFNYRFKGPQGRSRTIRFVFVGRTVIQVYLN